MGAFVVYRNGADGQGSYSLESCWRCGLRQDLQELDSALKVRKDE